MKMNTTTTDTILGILDDLVSFNTVSDRSNKYLIDYVVKYSDLVGVSCEIIDNPDGSKQGLILSTRPEGEGAYILSAHTDVVPVAGQKWTSDPFVLKRSGEYLFGRGTTDMKGFIAVALALLPALVALGRDIRPVHVVLSFDEEIGCAGIPYLMPSIKARLSKAMGCIVGEPTQLKTVLGHKGKQSWRAHLTGRAAHSAMPGTGINAISLAAMLVRAIDAQASRQERLGTKNPAFMPPVSTMQVGLISGGSALNIVPDTCSIDFEVRNLPADPIAPIFDAILSSFHEMAAPILDESGQADVIRLERLAEYPGLATDALGAFPKVANEILADNAAFETVSFGTEAGYFAQAGIPTIVWGPGSMSDAHKPDEFIAIGQLIECYRRLHRLLMT